MFTTPKNNMCKLKIGRRVFGDLEVKDRHLLVNTIDEWGVYMTRLKYYNDPDDPNDPQVKMVFLTTKGRSTMFSKNGSLFVTRELQGGRRTDRITGLDFDLPKEVPLEELLFRIVEELIAELRKNQTAWLDATCPKESNETPGEYENRKRLYKENFDMLVDNLENKTKRAEAECRVPKRLRQFFAYKHLMSGCG